MIQVHVIPENDGYAHIPHDTCPCQPEFGADNGAINTNLFIHQAADDRPAYKDIWASPNWKIVSKLI